MKKHLQMVKAFHQKFAVPVLNKAVLIPQDRSDLRYHLMQDEVREYLEGVKNQDLANVAKELADILYSVYGTILEHGLQDKIEAVFEEVHRSNMSKEYHKYKMVKGKDYQPAELSSLFEESD